MTTQEKIEVLEKAVGLIDHKKNFTMGVCRAIFESVNPDLPYDGRAWDIEAIDWMKGCGIELPQPYKDAYCWPVTEEGDEQRREFLRFHIERLKATL